MCGGGDRGHEEVTLKGNSGCEVKRGVYNLISPGKERLDLTVIGFGYSWKSVLGMTNRKATQANTCSESLEEVGESVRRHALLNAEILVGETIRCQEVREWAEGA